MWVGRRQRKGGDLCETSEQRYLVAVLLYIHSTATDTGKYVSSDG